MNEQKKPYLSICCNNQTFGGPVESKSQVPSVGAKRTASRCVTRKSTITAFRWACVLSSQWREPPPCFAPPFAPPATKRRGFFPHLSQKNTPRAPEPPRPPPRSAPRRPGASTPHRRGENARP